MSDFTWDDRYLLDVPVIDAQHQRWFALTNEYWRKYQSGTVSTAATQKALTEVVSYARKHLKFEEELMRSIRYPASDLKWHVTMHNAFVERITALARRCRAGHPRAPEEMVQFLTGWLVRHIIQTDVKYVGHFKRMDSVGNWQRKPAAESSRRLAVAGPVPSRRAISKRQAARPVGRT
jgi:hemerythrin